MARVIRHGVAVGLLFAVVGAHAQTFADEAIQERLQSIANDAYETVIADYDAKVAENPNDIILHMHRCEVIDYFVYEGYYVEAAENDSATCRESIKTRFPGHIEHLLHEVGTRFDDNVIRDIYLLFRWQNNAYNQSQLSRLYKALSDQHSYQDNGDLRDAEAACVDALELDVAANCRLAAARYLLEQDHTEAAIDVLTSPLDPRDDPYYRVEKVSALADIGAVDAVQALYSSFEEDELYDHLRISLSNSLAKVDLAEEAMTTIAAVSDDYWDSASLLKARFDLALQVGETDQAHAFYYQRKRDDKWTDPLLRERMTLAGQDLSLGWRWVDLIGVLMILLAIAMGAAVSAVIPAAAHYRGLVRLRRGVPPGVTQSVWSLGNAWYAIFVFVFVSMLAMYVYEYDLLYRSFMDDYWDDSAWADANLPRILIANTVFSAVFLLPLFVFRSRWKTLGSPQWSLGKCLLIGFGLAVLFRLLFAIPVYVQYQFFSGDVLITAEAIQQLYETYGLFAIILVTGIVVPIIEEFGFRGAILGGLSRHISYTWANIIQSLLFASLHESLIHFPAYFVLAYVAGVITKRSGGLLPAIILHMLFNIGAVVAMVYTTS